MPAGRPKKYVPEFYAVEAAQKAQRVSVGIVGKGRPSREKVIALLTLRGDKFPADASTDRLTFILDESVSAELAKVRVLAAPTATATKVRTGPITEKGRKIAATRAENVRKAAAVARAESMGLVMLPGVKLTPSKRSRKAITA